ncbi:MAG TPA: hypothetical protein VIM70_12440 [Clostridium sp.]|uniref:hypothetical protein n=1 Tax=Clostridium sp. TaxID=1506 RepID=UPI002F93559B
MIKRCNRIACRWFLFRSDFSAYTGEKYWQVVKQERENCPKNCEKYIERQEINRINNEKYGELKNI